MDTTLLYDAVSVANTAAQTLTFSSLQLRNHPHLSIVEDSPPSLQISAFIFPVDAVAPPRVRPTSFKTATRTLLHKKRRSRRRSSNGDDGGDLFASGGDGPFFNGGWGGGGGGGGWNFDRFGGNSWDDSSSSSRSDPAIDFFYEVMGWIALSSCVHFGFKRMVRIVADGLGDDEREKVPLRLASVC